MRSLMLILALLTGPFTFSQKQLVSECGSVPDGKSMDLIQAAIETGRKERTGGKRSVTTVPLKVWWMTDSLDTESITGQIIQMLVHEANAVFEPAHLAFYQCQAPETIISAEFVDFTLYEESSLRSQYYLPELINLYIFNSLTAFDGTSLCGYAKFPGSSDMIFMDKDCLLDGSTLNHELGHFFGLYHTHGISNSNPTNELANGANCTVAGDDVCDTPADPNLKEVVDNNCNYTGNATDPNGDPYMPDPSNLMCYAPSQCRNDFSTGQLERIDYVFRYLRGYLHCDAIPTQMSITSDEGMCADAITANGTYSGDIIPASISWDVDGDDLIDYTGHSFTHVYTEPADYHVTMFIDDGNATYSVREHNAVQLFSPLEMPVEYHFNRPQKFQYHLENPENDHTWYETRIGAQTQDYCLSIDNYHNYQRGETDAVTLPPVTLNGQTFAFLSFDVAYAYHGINYEDQLEVLISEDCGESFQSVYIKSGSELATVDGIILEHWMPQAPADWRRETIDLTPFLGETILIRFVNTNDFGNHLYLDQIEVDGDEVLAYESFTIEGKKVKDGFNRIHWEITEPESLERVWLEGGTELSDLRTLHRIDLEGVHEGLFDHLYKAGTSNYYRLAGIDEMQDVRYSNLIFIPGNGPGMVKLYPNPVVDRAILQVRDEGDVVRPASFRIYNQQGIECMGRQFILDPSRAEITLETENLPPGMYFLQLDIQGTIHRERFVKR